MNVLVTGATGFLGRHLLKELCSLNWNVNISNTRVANLNEISNLYQYNDIRFDYIFHLAAVTKAGDYCLNYPGDQWISNQTINTNILAYWRDHQPQAKMVCMGTSCSYSPGIVMEESNYLLGEPEASLYTYAMTKRMLLTGLTSLQKQYGLKWLYFVPSTLYGPDFELDDNHFIFDFIRNCYNAKNKGDDFVLWGDGYQKRELVYIKDACNAMLGLLDHENEVFNLGSGQDHTIRQFAQKVCKIFDYDFGLVKYDLTKYVGAKEKNLVVSKAVKQLGGSYCGTSLEDGLKEAIEYFARKN